MRELVVGVQRGAVRLEWEADELREHPDPERREPIDHAGGQSATEQHRATQARGRPIQGLVPKIQVDDRDLPQIRPNLVQRGHGHDSGGSTRRAHLRIVGRL